jgi:FKBP-type peptidyl-prolyl cis-trans isomerase FkpA
MKKCLFIATLAVVLFACSKTSDTVVNNCVSTLGVPSDSEIAVLQTYINSKGITATKDSRGFFYTILGPGYGIDFPNASSTVTVKYKGSLMNGTIFDSTVTGSTATFPLSGVITGWRYGIPLIKKGGVINLYLPPSLAYGCAAQSGIPAGSPLIFNVEITNY